MYGGTASEMYRLLKRAAELDKTFAKTADFSIDSKGHLTAEFADITQAIHIVQTEMGITGTTAEEAGRTISGSVGSMKSAWKNLLTGLADGNADIGQLVDDLVTTIVGDGTENNLGVIGNVLPAVKTALSGAGRLVGELLPKIVEEIPSIISENLPIIVQGAVSLVKGLAEGIVQNAPALYDAVMESLHVIFTELFGLTEEDADTFISTLDTAFRGLSEAVGEVVDTISDFVDWMNSGSVGAEALKAVIVAITAAIVGYKAAVGIATAVSNGLAVAQGILNAVMSANPIGLVIAAIAALAAGITFLWNTNDGFKEALTNAWEWIADLAKDVWEGVANFFTETIPDAFNSVIDWFKDVGQWFEDIGKNIVDGIKSGIKKAWDGLTGWFSDLWDGLVGGVCDLLGIHSPSRVFAGIGRNMALGVGEGWEDEFGDIQDDIDKSLAFDDPSMSINASVRKVGAGAAGGPLGGTSIGSITINIDGAKYNDEQDLAEAVALAIQDMTERRAAVYA